MTVCTLRFLIVLFPALALVQAYQPAAETGDYVVEKNVMVPMRDGVRLATDLYFPARGGVRLDGKLPAIMERTPYNKDVALKNWAPYYAVRGYVCIARDTCNDSNLLRVYPQLESLTGIDVRFLSVIL